MTAQEHSGVMVAFMLDDSDAKALLSVLPDSLPPCDELHLTLAYLGDKDSLPASQEAVSQALASFAASCEPISGTVSGFGRFFNAESDGGNALYASFDAPGLPDLRQGLVEALSAAGVPPDATHGFTPHITLAYVPAGTPTPQLDIPAIRLVFNRLTLAWGGSHTEFPIGPSQPAVTKGQRILNAIDHILSRFKAAAPATTTKAAAGPETAKPSDLIVTKAADGRYRWVLVSSSAFEDQDREVISLKALQSDVDRADADGSYGPLRWWHVSGAEIGDCDFNMLYGRLLYESGTFRDERTALAVKEHAAELGVSIGFTHPDGEPDADGVFHSIRRFERSLLPREVASNTLSAVPLIEKENQMTPIEDKLKAFGKLLGGGPEMVQQVLALGESKEKAAEAAGTRFKEAGSAAKPGETFEFDGAAFVKLASGEVLELKAKQPAASADAPPVTESAALDKPYSEAEATDETPIGRMTRGQLTQHIQKSMAPHLDKMGGDLKDLLASHAKVKETTDADAFKKLGDKLDSMSTDIRKAQAGVDELKGDLPRGYKSWRASQDGPQPPAGAQGAAPAADSQEAEDPWAKHFKAIGAAVGAPAA